MRKQRNEFWLDVGAAVIGAAITTALMFVCWLVVGSPMVASAIELFVIVYVTAFVTDLIGKVGDYK